MDASSEGNFEASWKHRHHLRSVLFSETLQYVQKYVPWYSRSYANLPSEINIGELDKIPLLKKETVISHYEEFINHSLQTAAVQHTSGTTQNSFILQRSPEELKYVYQFFSEVSNVHRDSDKSNTSFIVTLGRNTHGDPILRPYKNKHLTIDLSNAAWRPHLKNILGSNQSLFAYLGNECNLIGPAHQILFLTTILIDDGFDFSTSLVKSISCSGEYLTETKYAWLENTWGVKIRSDFSICEVSGYAAKCTYCSNYHYEPIVLPDVIDIETGQSINHGIGFLTLTSLYPFTQKMPLIKYLTGDLVKVSRGTCEVDSLGFTPMGRVPQSIIQTINNSLIIIPSADVLEVLDEFPDVAHVTTGHQYQELSSRYDVGYPLARLVFDKNSNEINLFIRLRYSPNFFWRQSAILQRLIEARMVEKCEGLQRLTRERLGKFSVQLLPPPKNPDEAAQWSYRISQP